MLFTRAIPLYLFGAGIGMTSAAVIQKRADPIKVVIGNDDGWATANIRAFYNALNQAGFKSMISAPTENKSGSSGIEFPPIPLLSEGEFGTIPIGAPPTGSDPSDGNIFYVNSFPATAIEHGITEFAQQALGGKPDLAVTGPNVGDNIGLKTQFSGTVGAAVEAVSLGVPAIAFSGAGGTQHSFTEADPVAEVYAQVALKLVNTVVAAGKPYLPDGVALNVNIPFADATTCTQLEDYSFVLSRVNPDINPFTKDVDQCGTNSLPTESKVSDAGGCRVSVSVLSSSTKLDVDKDKQGTVRDKISSLLSCLP